MKEIKSVLFIDDNQVDIVIGEHVLKKSGLCETIYKARNGKEALEFLQMEQENKIQYGDTFPPSLIFLDVHMPIMDGFEFLEVFEEANFDYDSIIILMTFSEEDQREAKKYKSVKGFMSKPLKRKNICELLEPYFLD